MDKVLQEIRREGRELVKERVDELFDSVLAVAEIADGIADDFSYPDDKDQVSIQLKIDSVCDSLYDAIERIEDLKLSLIKS